METNLVKQNKAKRYLGDGVYVEFDGFGITLTTSNGIVDTNTIYLEPEVWENLKRAMISENDLPM